MCGYGAISFLVKDVATSQAITIPYRIVVLVLSLFLLLFNFGIVYPQKKYLAEGYNSTSAENPVRVLTFVFLLCYSFRLIYDVFMRTDSVLFMEDRNQYIIIWFFITLIPGANFFFLDKLKVILVNHYLA
jgi:hypothetical protein